MQYRAPNGHLIAGTYEMLYGVAQIMGVDKIGDTVEIEYAGETEVDWDSQKPVLKKGKRVFVCEKGRHWTEDQLTLCEDEDGDDSEYE